MPLELVITAVGPDRAGIVTDFAGRVHAAGARLSDTRMMNVRGRFALIALVEGSAAELEDVKKRLTDAAASMGMAIDFSGEPRKETAPPREGLHYRLKAYSMEQPDVVHQIARCLAEHGVNVEELVTSVESAPFMGTPVVMMEMVMFVPRTVNMKELRAAIVGLCDEINCDVDLVAEAAKRRTSIPPPPVNDHGSIPPPGLERGSMKPPKVPTF